MATNADPTWTKTLLAPVRDVPHEAARGHALQNCRTVAKAAADLLRTDISARTPERVSRFKRAAGDLRAHIGESASGALRAVAEPVDLDAADLLRAVCDRAHDCAEAKNVSLILHAKSSSRIRVRARARDLSEAMFNLVANAIDATRPGYPVIVRASTTRDGNVLWEVQDSGEGMSTTVLAWLGEPFRSTRAGAQGSGVAIARAIVEAHGGMLSYESALGLGTTASAWTPSVWA